MAKHGREERQHRRWLEDARKHLGRGDLEGMLPAMLRLPPSRREEFLPRGAALFRQSVQEQHRRGTWGLLGTLAARADAEPRLVERGVDVEEAQATYWPLVWAAGRARDWSRAQRLWRPLADTARARAPQLATAVEAWLSARGTPPPEAVAPALACLPPVDERLGMEPLRWHAQQEPPRSLEEVEGAVLALCAAEPFHTFASTIEAWAKQAPADMARAVWEFAGQLAARELWLRLEADQGLVESASLLSQVVREAGAPQSLAAPVLQALRAMFASLPPESLSRAREAEAWCSLAHAAALYPDARPWVVQAVARIRFSESVLPQALRLYEALLALSLDVSLWARAFLAWGEEKPEAERAPAWLQEGLRRLIESQVPAMLGWMRGTQRPERMELVEVVASTCSRDLVEAWVEACWEGADEELRGALSEAIFILLDRSRAKTTQRHVEQVLRGVGSFEDAMRVLREMEGALAGFQATRKLSPEGLRTWRRFAPRVLTYRIDFLAEAVRHAASEEEAWEAATRYLEAHPWSQAHAEVLRTLEDLGREALVQRLLAQWLGQRTGDVEALAEAAVAAGRIAVSCKHLHPLLEAFTRALAEHPPTPSSEAVMHAEALAAEHGIFMGKKKRAPPRKRKSTRKRGGD